MTRLCFALFSDFKAGHTSNIQLSDPDLYLVFP